MPRPIEERILERISGLRVGTTMCPGRLSKDLGYPLADLRETYLALARAGRIGIRQKSRPVNLDALRGPFRVGPPPD